MKEDMYLSLYGRVIGEFLHSPSVTNRVRQNEQYF